MSEERRRVLDLLAQGKITVDEADQLLRAIGSPPGDASMPPKAAEGERPRARFLRITVQKAANQWRPEKQVNIRVPISLVKSGVQLGAIIPDFVDAKIAQRLREHGIDIDLTKIDRARIDDLVNNFGEMDFDIDAGKAKVRITCE